MEHVPIRQMGAEPQGFLDEGELRSAEHCSSLGNGRKGQCTQGEDGQVPQDLVWLKELLHSCRPGFTCPQGLGKLGLACPGPKWLLECPGRQTALAATYGPRAYASPHYPGIRDPHQRGRRLSQGQEIDNHQPPKSWPQPPHLGDIDTDTTWKKSQITMEGLSQE